VATVENTDAYSEFREVQIEKPSYLREIPDLSIVSPLGDTLDSALLQLKIAIDNISNVQEIIFEMGEHWLGSFPIEGTNISILRNRNFHLAFFFNQ